MYVYERMMFMSANACVHSVCGGVFACVCAWRKDLKIKNSHTLGINSRNRKDTHSHKKDIIVELCSNFSSLGYNS